MPVLPYAVAVLVLFGLPGAAADLNALTVAPETGAETYDRKLYAHWLDLDGNSRDAREDVLVAESLVPVQRDLGTSRKILSGLWIGQYCGYVTADPGALDIDHMVPLKEVHESGGHAWSEDRRRAYANDTKSPRTLIAVKAGCNRSKGAKDPAEWMPPNRTHWCQYLDDWIAVKQAWGLTVDRAEFNALKTGLKICSKYEAGDHIDGRH